MNKASFSLIIMVFLFVNNVSAESEECAALKKLSYEQIQAKISKASIVHYEGTVSKICACPFSFDTVYNQYCGANSAYYKNPKAAIKCFPKDVSYVDIANYKKSVCGTSTNEEDTQNPTESTENINNENYQQ